MSAKSCAAALCLAVLAACGGAGSPTTVDVSAALTDSSLALSSGPVASVDTGTNDVNFATILNNLRLDRGLSPFSHDRRLDRAAQKHAEDMLSRGYFSHTTLGSNASVQDRILAEGYDPRGWAENIAQGQRSQGEVLQAWVDSPGHNRNLNANLEDFALGAAGSGSKLTWVLVLATER